MKSLKIIFALSFCLFALPTFANGEKEKSIRKEKKRFQKEVRSMKEAKNHPSGQEIAYGKFGA
jgi:hypothetical protein